MKLGRDEIVEAALGLVDERGLDALNMRALAKRLGVQASALYWHVGSKDELLSLMAAQFYRKAFETATGGANWRDWLAAFGHALRTALLAHRDSARLCAIARPIQDSVQARAEQLAGPLVAAGLSRDDALTYEASVISLTLGWVVYEQSNALHDHLAELVGFDRSYGTGLEALVRGFSGPEI